MSNIKYIIPKGTTVGVYHYGTLRGWVNMPTDKKVVYRDPDIMFANSRAECRRKYGDVIADAIGYNCNFGPERRKIYTYFLVPDNKRPLIEVENRKIIIVGLDSEEIQKIEEKSETIMELEGVKCLD